MVTMMACSVMMAFVIGKLMLHSELSFYSWMTQITVKIKICMPDAIDSYDLCFNDKSW